MLGKIIAVIVVTTIFLGCSSSGRATEIIPSTLEYMTRNSDLIMTGRVERQESHWQEDLIVTDVIVVVDRFIKDNQVTIADSITVRVPGGQVGDVTLTIDQAPRFENDQRVLLFLRRNSDHFQTFGMNYGKYHIEHDETLNKDMVSGPLFNNSFHVDLKTRQKTPNRSFIGRQELHQFIGALTSHLP